MATVIVIRPESAEERAEGYKEFQRIATWAEYQIRLEMARKQIEEEKRAENELHPVAP